MAGNGGWIGVDLDGTLAMYDGWQGAEHIGAPVPLMLARVKEWLAEGKDVRIFTARVFHDGTPGRLSDSIVAKDAITRWCVEHVGQALQITNMKDYGMLELWDDRAIQIVPNSGQRADGQENAERFSFSQRAE